VRIAGELRERGIDEDLIAQHVNFAADWQAAVQRVARKRFGAAPAGDSGERARRSRFLQYRGFTHAQIQQYLQSDSDLPQ
jgi:regulatory protein